MRKKRGKAISILIAVEFSFAFLLAAYGLYLAFGVPTPPASALAATVSGAGAVPAASPAPASLPSPSARAAVVTPTPNPTPDPTPPPPATMIFTGDLMLDGSVRNIINKSGLDAVFPKEYRGPFQNANIAMVDLEMPISTRGTPVPDKEYTYRGDPSGIALLKDMGVDIVTVANNHTLDYGQTAFLDTLDLLTQNGIKYVGGGKDLNEAKQWVILQAGDKKVAFLAASRVIPTVDWYATKYQPGLFTTYDPTALDQQIALAKKEADYVVVFVHWGVEKNTAPENYQRDMAHGYIDAGADAVVACHPHVLQGFEYYKGKLIAYSLGNFIFTDAKKDTAALEITINGDGSLSAKLYPYEITNRSTAPMTDPAQLAALRAHLNDISFGAEIGEDFGITAK